jgi:glucose/arabinose dehydrogenase
VVSRRTQAPWVATMTTRSEPGSHGTLSAPDLASWLAYLYSRLQPITQRVQLHRTSERAYDPADILLPEGFVAEAVVTGLTAPVHMCFSPDGRCFVFECGHKTTTPPRIYEVDLAIGTKTLLYEEPESRWVQTGALTGGVWYEGALYFCNTDRISRLDADGSVTDVVTGLPGRGDHQANHPVVGPDGYLYWGQGSATNLAVVGADDYAYEWLPKFPQEHDVPAEDITLNGRNFRYRNVLGNLEDWVESGAYLPFGTPSQPGQVIPGSAKASGAVLRWKPGAGDVEVVAWGLRNPYGLAFTEDGKLFATEHGIDERGERQIIADPDDLYEIRSGAWYGWPDYASGIRLDDPRWGKKGRGREPLLVNPPDPNPPKPFVSFTAHAAANGFDFCPSPDFGFPGDAFVALYGDVAPVTTRPLAPVGFKVVRVDMKSRQVVDFAVNRIAGPASKLPHNGLDRPSHCAFGPDGSLYIVDFGEIEIALEKGGIRMPEGGGGVWRIRRTSGPHGQVPDRPKPVPLYGIQGAALVGGAALGIGLLVRRLLHRKS